MNNTIELTKTIRLLSRTGLIAAGLILAGLFISCCCFLFSGHDQLAHWYLGLNAPFYKSSVWSTSFFTKGIKSDGNIYCILALLVTGFFLWLTWSRFKKRNSQPSTFSITYNTADIIPVLLSLLSTILLWLWGNRTALPASDEVFSALNVAAIHPLQAVSYYMLPNNHLFFNLLNNLVFHFCADKVFTGRLISLLAYATLILILYYWLKDLIKNRWLALLVSITLGLQFQVWGFSFQARGYEVYLLAEWGMVISLFRYLLSGNDKWLRWNVLSCTVGFFCLPSFLYFYLAQLAFVVIYRLVYKTKDLLFWKHQLATIGLTYLCYLPMLCFSGVEAITKNSYIVAMGAFKDKGRLAFAQWMFTYVQPYITHIFSDLQWNNVPVSMILYFLPLLLIFNRKNKANVVFGLLYACMWLCFFGVVIVMLRLPFERNLTGQYSFTLLGVLLVALWLADALARLGKTAFVKWILFPGITLLFAIHFLRTNEFFLKDTLYEYDVNAYYKEKTLWLANLPAGSTVAFSDEDFYSYFVCLRSGYKVSRYPTGMEQYYIKEAFEEIPQPYTANYELAKKQDGNEIWKRK